MVLCTFIGQHCPPYSDPLGPLENRKGENAKRMVCKESTVSQHCLSATGFYGPVPAIQFRVDPGDSFETILLQLRFNPTSFPISARAFFRSWADRLTRNSRGTGNFPPGVSMTLERLYRVAPYRGFL